MTDLFIVVVAGNVGYLWDLSQSEGEQTMTTVNHRVDSRQLFRDDHRVAKSNMGFAAAARFPRA
jgi:hypothetical protein